MQLKFLCPLFLLAIAPATALAQAPSPPAAAAAPSPAYQSAFADYKPYKEPVVMSWREANDQVRDTGGMQGHEMATMKSQPADPHAGHDMSTMARAKPAATPHAGHDMSKMTPAKPAAAAPPKKGATPAAKRASAVPGAKPMPAADPHAGHDMTKMPAPAPKSAPTGTVNADHGAHGAPDQSKNKKESE